MNTGILRIEILSYWHPGTGRGGGTVVDAAAHRDSAGLPVIPGRHLKGLLRHALERAEAWGWPGYSGLAQQLFGTRSEYPAVGGFPLPGCLRVSDARLPEAVANWLATGDGKKLTPRLFRSIHATAIDADSGAAKDGSLRGIEVVIPLTLEARIDAAAADPVPTDWSARLDGVLPLIDAVGAHRARGLGRAILTLEQAA